MSPFWLLLGGMLAVWLMTSGVLPQLLAALQSTPTTTGGPTA